MLFGDEIGSRIRRRIVGAYPNDYAHGILNICRCYVESPSLAASGVTGSELNQWIREIMTQRRSRLMTPIRKAALTAAGLGAIAVPLVVEVVRAQSTLPPPVYTYGVVSIRACKPGPQAYSFGRGPQGGIRARAVSVSNLLAYAYGVRDSQIWVVQPGYGQTVLTLLSRWTNRGMRKMM
jgi:hypothetical protein